jgi:peroxiredoxin (alkyl hydroperoxide reductase subunit C)
VFFIGDQGILRAMLYQPLRNGRFIPEIIDWQKLQITHTFKTSNRCQLAAWQQGSRAAI